MGNVFVMGVGAVLPMTIHKSIIPTLASPALLGGAPWRPPNTLVYLILYLVSLYAILWTASFLSNTYYTLKNCKESNATRSAMYANITPIMALFGFFLNQTFLLPFVKSYMLIGMQVIPYAQHIANGILIAPFVFLGSFIAHGLTSKDICGDY